MSDTKQITCTVQGTEIVSRDPTPFSLGGMMEVWQDVVDQCKNEVQEEETGLRPVTLKEQLPSEVTIDMAKLMRMLYKTDGAAAQMNACLWQTADGDPIPDDVAAHVPVQKTARLIHHFIAGHVMLMGALTDTLSDT